MARGVRDQVYQGYRDAVGALLAAARKDEEGLQALRAYSPALDTAVVDALIAIGAGLMREVDNLGGDGEATVSRWAINIARREATK